MNEPRASSRLTGRDREYATCEWTRAQLLVYPDERTHEEITRMLGVEPTTAHNKGDLRTNSIGRTSRVPLNVWFLSSEHDVDSRDLRDHLDWLTGRLSGTESKLHALQSERATTMRVSCSWWSAHGRGGPALWPEQMAALARLKLECTFYTLYCGDE